ncbi:MAG: hypothetical protein A3J28_00695 [Acidobacteria bacterium RIFCSPLOWO2_12_FULL_60_22]|nr:MAG: hypothetical protein A3J28_00695 [Acidobacteria bacterium RIFCSPLOWO2_12_FULL_60_22]
MGVYVTTGQIADSDRSIILQFQNRLPIDVHGLAAALGIQVWESSSLEPNIAGILRKDHVHGGSSGYSIVVRAQDALVRKRFTVAHELGHFLLHRKEIGDQISDDEFYRGGLSSAKETEANRVAADILMPHHLIRAMIAAGTKDVSALANAFGVSQMAMMIRLGIPIP